MSAATITSKGQLTLPKAVRDRLELGPGDRVDFGLAPDGRFDSIPVKASIKILKGCVPAPKNPSPSKRWRRQCAPAPSASPHRLQQ